MEQTPQPTLGQKLGRTSGCFVAWAWTIVAGGGGLGLIITRGPWPLTNGWFALFSGISACPLTFLVPLNSQQIAHQLLIASKLISI